jgi:hypothetical protein
MYYEFEFKDFKIALNFLCDAHFHNLKLTVNFCCGLLVEKLFQTEKLHACLTNASGEIMA